ncbi:la-related protein 6B-like [Iris pallida]|uniref:La-related protein 6B-like n=1 Tax=Iris pallida TaxID=29817 RepID=A0AAX6ENX4_IRIPA|nr:la-related protein 6B-like [Iris pallida]
MAQETLEPSKTLEVADGDGGRIGISSSGSSAGPSLSRNTSLSRLNAGAPAFVPRAAPPPPTQGHHGSNRVKIHHGSAHHHHLHQQQNPHQHQQQQHQFVVPVYDYYGGGGGGFGETEADPDPGPDPARDGLSEDVIQKITKQVEYYFSDANLATTEHLMRFITKDPEGFVPIAVIGSFKKIKALAHNNALLATALKTSNKLVVSEDGKKVRRQKPFTELDVEELQSRIVVAENLPEDHCYQSLMKVFSVVGSVKTIRTCYPQTPNGTTSATNRSSKIDMLFSNKLHAFVEYEIVEDAEKAVVELNDERNWRSGLRVRLLRTCMVHPSQVQTKNVPGRGRKPGQEGDGNGEEEEDVSTINQPKGKQVEEQSQATDASLENLGDDVLNDKEGGAAKRGRGRGRGGGKGRGRGQYHHNNNNNNTTHHNHHHRGGGHAVGTPPSSHLIHSEHPAASKQPPGPRMPDGTRGFTMGRGRPVPPSSMG